MWKHETRSGCNRAARLRCRCDAGLCDRCQSNGTTGLPECRMLAASRGGGKACCRRGAGPAARRQGGGSRSLLVDERDRDLRSARPQEPEPDRASQEGRLPGDQAPQALAGPLADPDSDGQTNAFEFTAGLIPTDTTGLLYDPFADVFPRLFKGIFDDAAAAAPARRRVGPDRRPRSSRLR